MASVLFALMITGGDCCAAAEFVQSEEHFERAIRNRSTRHYVVYVTIVNDNTAAAYTGCHSAGFLIGAIYREHNDRDSDSFSWEAAIRTALANSSHVFHFSRKEAIDNLPLDERQLQHYREACELVRQGKSVFFADLTGELRIDP
jgi:hypothetical protein